MIQVTPEITLDEDEIELRFVRASGPGGQNVNKVSTAVQLRFDVASSPSLEADVKVRLIALAGRRVTAEGVLLINAQQHRTQERNRQDAVDRLVALIRVAAEPTRERRATRPSRQARRRRRQDKQRRSETKRQRRPVRPGDD